MEYNKDLTWLITDCNDIFKNASPIGQKTTLLREEAGQSQS